MYKPDSLFRLYLPLFLYFGWQLCVSIQFTLSDKNYVSVVYAVLCWNFYGMIHSYHWQGVMLFNWIYNLVLLGGFTAGERLAFRKTKVVRKPLRIKYVCLAAICCILVISIIEGIWLYSRRDIVKKDPKLSGYGFAYENSGYGFPYEHGYSSTDLEPYYVENEENILAKLDAPSTFTISEPAKMPVLDGAEAAYPIYSAFADACYENIGEIQEYAKQNRWQDPDAAMPIQFNNSIIAFENLVAGDTDIFFGTKPSAGQQEMAAQAGKELVLTPVGKEAFIFFVNSANPVDGLTSDQIRDIYSGEINNWKEIGGAYARILAFQRPKNSGSQTMMEYFMGNTPLKEPLQTEYYDAMSGIILETANYQNRASAIGYSFRYFATIMVNDMDYSDHIKYLSVDGVYPDVETIRSGAYPITTELYAVTLADNPNENVELFLEWMTSPQGQQIVADTGYVAIQEP
ncbi:MAG: hypothetical protein HDR05_02810 [Lachnospiraceae bacterium]|nr:hypothetical protein [Lachnospiraceae bacterium]